MFSEFGQSFSAKLRDVFRDETDVGGFAAFSPVRNGSEEGAIGFQQKRALGQMRRAFLNGGCIFKGYNPGERHEKAEVE